MTCVGSGCQPVGFSQKPAHFGVQQAGGGQNGGNGQVKALATALKLTGELLDKLGGGNGGGGSPTGGGSADIDAFKQIKIGG